MTDETLRLACDLALAARHRADKRRRRAGSKRPAAERRADRGVDRGVDPGTDPGADPHGGMPADTPQRRSPMQRKGDQHEDAALRWLQARGLVLLARNLWTRAGELDLVMRDGGTLVFIEVRARALSRFGGAAASIGLAKQARLARAAAHWLPELARRHFQGVTPPARFDAVVFDAGRPQWLQDAFSLP